MKQKLFVAAVAAGAVGFLPACAKTTPVEGAPAPSPSETVIPSGTPRWTANIQSVTQSRGTVTQTTRDRSYGSATWTPGQGPTLSNIRLIFTYTGDARTLAWAILPGTCGSPALPMIPMSSFPELNIGGGGRAEVTTSLPLELPASGSYHIEIYRDRRPTTENIVACGNLRYSN